LKFKITGFLVLLVAMAQAEMTTPDQLWKYQHSQAGISMVFPAGWDISEEKGKAPPYLWKPLFFAKRPPIDEDEGKPRPGSPCSNHVEVIQVSTRQKPPGTQVEDDLKTYTSYLAKKYARNTFQVLQSGDQKGEHLNGKFLVYSYAPGGCKGSIQCVVFLYSKGKQDYRVACETCPERFKRYSDMFFRIARNFDAP
jgi:hypothetical protein